VRRDAPIFSLVLSKSRDWRHHDCSGAEPLFMDCNRGGCPDLGGTSIGSLARSSRSNFQSRSFLLGGRRGLARDQSMAPLSWDNCVVLRALDTAPINASIRLFEAVECRHGRRIPPLSTALASRTHSRRLCRPGRERPGARVLPRQRGQSTAGESAHEGRGSTSTAAIPSQIELAPGVCSYGAPMGHSVYPSPHQERGVAIPAGQVAE
jgi:hypothetical protein